MFMIIVDNKFIENFKNIQSLSDINTYVCCQDIFTNITSNNDSDINISKTFIELGGSFTNVLNTRFNFGYIRFNDGKDCSQNILFCNADLSTQIKFFLAIFLNFSNESKFRISSEVMLKLLVLKKIDCKDLYTEIINRFRREINNATYDRVYYGDTSLSVKEELVKEELAKEELETKILNDIINNTEKEDLCTYKSTLDIPQIQKVFQQNKKAIKFESVIN